MSWADAHSQDQRYARFISHIEVLRIVIIRMLDAVHDELESIDAVRSTTGAVYLMCRTADRHISIVGRIYRWYQQKYDQRSDSKLAPALQAADELIRSCWTEPFIAVHRIPPTGPLAYLDPRFDGATTPRISVPPDLRAPGDAIIGTFVQELPVPVIALPAVCASEPWWIVLVAHETGHHVHHDLDADLIGQTRTAIREATSGYPGNDELAADWQRWAIEAFADAFSVLMVGTAASWAVGELQHGPNADLVTPPTGSDRYPPPAVRLAFLGEVARAARLVDPGPGADDMRRWLTKISAPRITQAAIEVIDSHLAVTAAAAFALTDLKVGGVSLRELCAVGPGRYGPGGVVHRWAERLLSTNPTFTGRATRDAARTAIAAGVEALGVMRDGANAGTPRLRENLLSLLAACGVPGVLAAPPLTDIHDLADKFATRLIASRDSEEEF